MPNPWESSSSQLKSTLTDAGGARLVPPTRLTHVMLLPGQSSWQARVHNKFEEFSRWLRWRLASAGSSLRSGRRPQRTGLRVAAWSGPAATGWRITEQDQSGAPLCSSVRASCLGGRSDDQIRWDSGKFPRFQSRARVSSCETRSAQDKRLISVRLCAGTVIAQANWMGRRPAACGLAATQLTA